MPQIKRNQPLTPARATIRLEAMCARAERCERELHDKLWQWGISRRDADDIVASLRKRRFVDDTRFARAFVNDKVSFAKWGKTKIRVALMQKHINRDIINSVLEDIAPRQYQENLTVLLQAKARTLGDPATDHEVRIKLMRFGVSRGYEPGLVDACLRAISD